MPSQLLTTKVQIPALPPAYVPRPHLIQKLNKGIGDCKLTLITAPAGFGKTTLLTEWRTASDISLAWISLDETDNNLARFWNTVANAIEQTLPGTVTTTLALLQLPQPPPIESILTVLLNELTAIKNKLSLLFDNYHTIENSSIHTTVSFLVNRLPSHTHIIIAGRTEPPLPLAQLRARWELVEVHIEDLCFTENEVMLFFNGQMGFKLESHNITALTNRTEGWVAGLQMAATAMRHHPNKVDFIERFTSSYQHIVEFLAEELFQSQPDHIQLFLLKTSILDDMCASLCNALTGRNNSHQILQQLAQVNAFVIPLGNHQQWYCYHRLYSELLQPLREITALVSTEEVQKLHHRAAQWYKQEGMVDKAIHHALTAQNFNLAAQLIEHKVKTVPTIPGEATILITWIDTFPDEWLFSRPRLGLINGWALFVANRVADARQCLDGVKEQLLWEVPSIETDPEAGPDNSFTAQTMQVLTVALEAQIALAQGDVSQAIELFVYTLDELPDNLANVRQIITLNLNMAYRLNDDTENADRILAQFNSRDTPLNNNAIPLFATYHLAVVTQSCGQISLASLLYQQVLQLATQTKGAYLPAIVGAAHIELGHILYHWNDLDAAMHHLQKGVEQEKDREGIQGLTVGYIGMALAFYAQGDVLNALDMISQIEQLVQGFESETRLAWVKALQVRIWMAQGDIKSVQQWKRAYEFSMVNTDGSEPGEAHLFGHIVLAWAQIALGELDSALAWLEQLQYAAESIQQPEALIKVLVLQALAFQLLGNVSVALEVLGQALTLAKEQGYIRLFIEEGDFMTQLLYLAVEYNIEADYARKLLNALETSASFWF